MTVVLVDCGFDTIWSMLGLKEMQRHLEISLKREVKYSYSNTVKEVCLCSMGTHVLLGSARAQLMPLLPAKGTG